MKLLISVIVALSLTLVGCNVDSGPAIETKPAEQQPTGWVSWSWLNKLSTTEPLFTNDNDIVRKNYYIVFDGSGSMSGDRVKVASAATIEFIKMLDKDVAIGINAFDSQGTMERVALAPNNAQSVIQAINQIDVSGGTPLDAAVKMAFNKLRERALRQRGYGEYHIIIVTDGEANSGQDPRNSVRAIVRTSPVQVHTIGFKLDNSHSLNQPGLTNYYPADDYAGIMRGFSSILAESETFDDTTFN